MRVLVTGSSGQLGGTLAAMLAPRHEVLGLDVRPGPWTTHLGAVQDRELVFRLLRGAGAVLHTAALHAPHVALRSKQEFVEANVTGTLHLLEAAVQHGAGKFVYTSTTSLYGHALVPHDRAVWVTEELEPRPRDIYDITKLAAEHLCRQLAAESGLEVLCLRTSRFWNEAPELRAGYRLYRGLDVRDAAEAHLLALQATHLGFEVFNVSALSPFAPEEAEALLRDATAPILRHFPQAAELFARRGWSLPRSIDRVYAIGKAQRLLGYRPRHGFAEVLQQIRDSGR